MNTLRAFQGIDTAFSVTLSPATVDFTSAPALTAQVDRGDGGAALATVTPTWSNTATDLVAVPFPGATSAALEPGHYFLRVKRTDNGATLSFDTLVIYPTPAGTSSLRMLCSPAEMIAVFPEMQRSLPQLDALPWLLEAATVACENYVGRVLAATQYDEIDYAGLSGVSRTMRLDSYPVTAFRLQANPQVGIQLQGPASATRATVTLAVNSATDLGIKTITLSSTGNVDLVLTLANYATIADLAAAVVLSGWTAPTAYGTRATTDLIAIDGPCTLGAKTGAHVYLFTDDVEGYQLDGQGGTVELGGVVRGSYWNSRTVRQTLLTAVRRTYTAGYFPVPKDLRSACMMMAIAIREASRVSGPIAQQGAIGRYYTLAVTVDYPATAKMILDQYTDDWAVA